MCPCLHVVWLAVGRIFTIEKKITWQKLTNPLLSPSAPQLYTYKSTRFHLFVIDVPSVSPLHLHIFLHIPKSFSYVSTSSTSFFTFSSSSILLFHLCILIPNPQFPSHLFSHTPPPHPHTFFKLQLHCFPTCASIPSPLCNLPPPF